MRTRRLALVTALLVAACGAPSPREAGGPAAVAADAADDAAIARAAEAYLALLCDTSPETATTLGLHQRDAELDDRSAAGHEAALDRKQAMLADLDARFAAPRASAAARTDLALVRGALRADLARARAVRPLARRPDVYAEPLEAIFTMTARDYAPADQRARNVLARLEKIPRVIDAARANLETPPRIWTEIGIEKAASAGAFLEAQRAFLTAALPGEEARIAAALVSAKEAYEAYRAFLSREVLPRSAGDFAAGRDLFVALLRDEAFVDETPEALLAIGKRVFAETAAEMDALARDIEPGAKGWPEVVRRLKANHPPAEGLLDAYRGEVARARRFLVDADVVPFPEGDDLDVAPTPPFLRSVISAAYDRPPPFDPSTKGFFFVTPIDPSLPPAEQEQMLREHGRGDLVDTAVHEAYPGHHLQLSFGRRHPSLVRKVADQPIFSEGWALYAEELMAELGYYTKEERLMQLEWTLVRAARVILDVGLHLGGMTVDDAIALLTREVHLERPLAVSEVKRYTLTPTQPLSYLIGREEIRALRQRYRVREGARFSPKAFHADLLSRGTIAPSLIAREMGLPPRR